MEGCLTRLLIWILEVLYSFSSLGFPFAAQLRPQNQCECNAVLPALKAACCRKSCGLREQLITTLSWVQCSRAPDGQTSSRGCAPPRHIFATHQRRRPDCAREMQTSAWKLPTAILTGGAECQNILWSSGKRQTK